MRRIQGGGYNIEPKVTIIPQQYAGGAPGTMLITVINGNPTSGKDLINDDWFDFAFDPPWGASVKLTRKDVIVDSPSGVLQPANFAVTVAAPGRVRTNVAMHCSSVFSALCPHHAPSLCAST